MKVSLSKDGWHTKLQSYVLKSKSDRITESQNLCPYFWTTVFCLVLLGPRIMLNIVNAGAKVLTRGLDYLYSSKAARMSDVEFYKLYTSGKWRNSVTNDLIIRFKQKSFQTHNEWWDYIARLDIQFENIKDELNRLENQSRDRVAKIGKLFSDIFVQMMAIIMVFVVVMKASGAGEVNLNVLLAFIIIMPIFLTYLLFRFLDCFYTWPRSKLLELTRRSGLLIGYIGAIISKSCPSIEWTENKNKE